MNASRLGPAMLRGIGRLGAGSCTIRSQVRRDRKRPRWGVSPTNAGLLHPGDLDHLDLGCDHVEQFADVLADHAKSAAAVRAGIAGIQLTALARRILRDAGPAARRLLWRGFRLFDRRRALLQNLVFFGRRGVRLRGGHHQVFERQVELFDIAFDLFGAGPELLLLEPGDPDASRQRRAFSATPGRGDHGPSAWPTSSRSRPARRSSRRRPRRRRRRRGCR